MPVFDQLQRASFDGLEFPVRSVQVRSRARVHTHEYLRVPGGLNEKLQRSLYTIEMEAEFHTTIKGYGTLWPNVLAALRNKYEQQITSELVIPTIGAIPAFLSEWHQTAEMGRVRSGEHAQLMFTEDQTEVFLSRALAEVDTSSIETEAANLDTIRKQIIPADAIAAASLFDSIQDTANAIFAIKDQSDLYGALLAAKVNQLTELLRRADREVDDLEDPENYPLVYALQDLLDAAITLERNLIESPRGPRLYTVPRTESVSDIATAIYGDTSRANEILLNNDVEDAFAVPAGYKIIYFAA